MTEGPRKTGTETGREPYAALAHRSRVERVQFGQSGVPDLYGAACSCGWESEDVWSDPEAAEADAARHEREAA